MFLKAWPFRPRLNAIFLAWKGRIPEPGSISSLNIRSGVFSATASISTPPSVEYTIIFFEDDLFSKTDI